MIAALLLTLIASYATATPSGHALITSLPLATITVATSAFTLNNSQNVTPGATVIIWIALRNLILLTLHPLSTITTSVAVYANAIIIITSSVGSAVTSATLGIILSATMPVSPRANSQRTVRLILASLGLRATTFPSFILFVRFILCRC
ncbi:hypothetical protein XAUC_40770 [Xanthomonas citri pv. aurantifolii str. ICPB 10535]|nr:hypothetical protein XAUC_40770 [Xanthomonas citri pv. aurantifolii str. ICPB 10535]